MFRKPHLANSRLREVILIISKRQVAYDLACKKILFQMIFACTVCITNTRSILDTTRHSNHIKLQSCLQRRAKRDFHALNPNNSSFKVSNT